MNVGPSGTRIRRCDQVVLGVADEDVAVKLCRVGAAAIDRHAGAGIDDVMADAGRFRGPHAVGDPPARTDLPPCLDGADPEDRHRAAGDVVDGTRDREIRVPRQLAARQDRLRDRVRFVARESVSPVVERVAELVVAGDELEGPGLGVEAEIAVLDRDPRRGRVVGRRESSRRFPKPRRRSSGPGPRPGC